MAAETINLVINPGVYVEVAGGHPCCYFAIRYRQVFRVHLNSDSTVVPDPDDNSYFTLEATGDEFARMWGGFSNLASTDGVWIRSEGDKLDDICVIRGDAVFSGR